MLFDFLKENRKLYVWAILAIIAAQFVMVQFPHILGQFFNHLQGGRMPATDVAMYAFLLLAVAIAYWILYGFGQFAIGKIARVFEYRLRDRLFSHWERLSMNYFRTRSIGDLLNHSMNDVRTVREALAMVTFLASAVFLLVAALYMAFVTVSSKLTLLALIPILLIPLAVLWFGPRIRESSRLVQEALSDMAELTEESLSSIRLIKGTANEQVELLRFSERVDVIVQRQMATIKRSALFQSFIPLMSSLSFAIALSYGGYMTLHGEIKLGGFVAFTLYLTMLVAPLQRIGFVANTYQRASASFTRLEVLLSAEPDIADPPAPIERDEIVGAVEMNLPVYRYPDSDQAVLRDVRFTLCAGETLGIVGRTGAGKTTLANLILRISDPPPNTVFVDGVDIRSMRLRTLRSAVAYVPQDGFLFSATIADNIGFARSEATAGEIEQAARDASFYADVLRFKSGFDTEIGERGVTLSGGQKQRAALARAFLKDAPILVADDSLSAVDTQTERAIIARMRELRQGKTTVIIAHRLSAVRHADLILVLERGRVAERGTHEELIRKQGLYAATYALQELDEEVSV